MKLYLKEDFSSPLSHQKQHELAMEGLDTLLREEYALTEWKIAVTEMGKPYLEDHPDICFNISHCPACIAAAVSNNEIGIDVERRFKWNDALVRRVCHPDEIRRLYSMSPAVRPETFYLIWSRKESYLKCLGQGFTRDPRSFDIGLKEGLYRTADGIFRFRQDLRERYTLVICEQIRRDRKSSEK